MKKSLFICSVLSLSLGALAQQRTDEEAIRAVADNLLKQPVTQFVGVKSGTIYNSTAEITASEEVRFRSPFSEWHYSNGVIDMSMLHLGDYLNEPKYVEYAKNHVAYGFANYKYFQKTYLEHIKTNPSRRHHTWCFGQLWTFRELDDCGAMGSAVVNVNTRNPRPEYKSYIDSAAYHILNRQNRLPDGTLCRTFPRQMTVWADDVYMGVSFLSQIGKATGDKKYFDEGAKQILQIASYLWDDNRGLFYHCYYSDLQRNGVAYWGRANGWITIANCMLIDAMPKNHPKRAELIALLEKQIVGFSRYQNENGMWNQLLDKPDSYDESSVTAMFVYGVAKAVNEGWIDSRYAGIARAGWNALKTTQITPEGHFKNVCVGTGIDDNLPFYYKRPVGENEKHGLGLIIDTGIEILKLNKRK